MNSGIALSDHIKSSQATYFSIKKLNINAAIIIVLANFLLTLYLAFCHILSNIANFMIIYCSFIFESLLYRYDNLPVMYYLLSHLVFIDYCFIFV